MSPDALRPRVRRPRSGPSIQLHGGIGFTWEHDAHLYWRRAKVDRFLLGDDVAAYDEVARLAVTR